MHVRSLQRNLAAVSTGDVDAFAQMHEDSEHNEDVLAFPLTSEHTSSKDNDVGNAHPNDDNDSRSYVKQATIASLPESPTGDVHDTGTLLILPTIQPSLHTITPESRIS